MAAGTHRHQRLLNTFLDAALEELLAAGVVSISDGDGIRGPSKFPVLGITRMARYVAAFTLLTIEASREGIHQLMWILNPVKIEAFESGDGGRSIQPCTS